MGARKYKEINCEIALNQLKRRMPYSWDLNIYRGCEHGCKYCFAIYSHEYLGSDNYCKDIYVKTNIIEQLEKQLSSGNWKREIVNIGGVSDSYQPAEEHYKLMPEILRLLIKYQTPAIISTKSDLILRDYDLINELSRITYINIAATITTVDEELRKLIEPGGVESNRRFKMLKTFRETNASVGLHVMPIIPYLTDSFKNIDSLFNKAKESNVHYVLPGTLYLRGKTRRVFFDFIKKEFSGLYNHFLALYKTGGADKDYKNTLYKTVNLLRDKYSLSSSYSKPMKEKLKKIE
ncbi:SPL family radical SAM protein [Candidatus Contubernalis alkaliaceticus]|uniref:SPL family radical SAM protein n=1 Tax=Candidatus Contubernalis alkaliaceticus TaxID=338645 RepID=UPI001F4BE256|nr:radical SAM protein [Candidatus Contubernalis alkalaceticus]UNC92099.1 radical SAM protein [Candidatus Contubernalis alkalaceticus]